MTAIEAIELLLSQVPDEPHPIHMNICGRYGKPNNLSGRWIIYPAIGENRVPYWPSASLNELLENDLNAIEVLVEYSEDTVLPTFARTSIVPCQFSKVIYDIQ